MKAIDIALNLVPRGLYLACAPTATAGIEPTMYLVRVDDTSDHDYPEGVMEYIKIGEITNFSYAPSLREGRGSILLVKAEALDEVTLENLVAVWDLEGTLVI